MEINVKHLAVPKVADAILSDYDITCIYGWRDGGKSTSILKVQAWRCLVEPHFRWALCRAKYNEIAGSIFQTMIDVIKEMNLENYFIIRKDRFQIINKINPNNYFFGASADQPDKIRSTPNLNGILAEEAHDFTEKDFSSLLGTTRNIKGQITKPKFIFVFNNDKVNKNSFIAKHFFNKESLMYSKVERVLISYEDNPYIDIKATEEKLLNVCLGDVKKFNLLKSGQFVQEENNSPWLYSLKYHLDKVFVDSLPFYKDMPLHISFDFNNDPLSCIVGQHSAGSHNNNKNAFIHILKEYQVSFKDFPDPFIEIKHRIEKDFAPKQIFITGDGSGYQGRMGLQAGSRHFYDTIKNVFNLGDYSILAPLSNPKHSASRTNFNTIIHKHPNYKIDKINCHNLFDDMNLAEATDKNGNGDELRKDRELFKMDILDAKRYYLWTHFNNFE